jgi:hypothetical protein
MLSTHSIFSGLQKTLKDKLTALPPNSDPELVDGLTKAHRKLSDYYYKFDQSPFIFGPLVCASSGKKILLRRGKPSL